MVAQSGYACHVITRFDILYTSIPTCAKSFHMTTPLTFKPVYKDYIWGGDRLATHFHRPGTPNPCAESWEISAHPDGPSIVANGPYAGRSLPELASTFGVALTGTKTPDPTRFPLLFKLIDANDKLSVQVHPNNLNAAQTQGEPKTEMWYVLDRVHGSRLYTGFREKVTPEVLRSALLDGTADRCLTEIPINPGDAIFIPGGLVHAIGGGCLIYEVQQNSNTTYRLFDWNRVGADGKARPLHIEESFKTIEWGLTSSPKASPETGTLVACDYFHVRKLTLAGKNTIPQDGTTFSVLFVESGRATVEAGGETVLLVRGTSCLIPAAAPCFTLAGKASILLTTL
jgi:mannose-6-phosphate isomerase